jgi:hypothetical protein
LSLQLGEQTPSVHFVPAAQSASCVQLMQSPRSVSQVMLRQSWSPSQPTVQLPLAPQKVPSWQRPSSASRAGSHSTQ